MFKRIMKIIAIALAAFVGAVGLGVAIYAISGGFKNEEIDILKLYVANAENDTNINKQEIYTLSDVPITIECEPKDATNKTLDVIVSDPLVPANEEYTGGILKDIPKTIQAGEQFTLKINKDEYNNNIGGVVTVKIRPEGDSSFTDVTLTIIVDTPVPDNSIYFSNNINDSYTTNGKNVLMAQSSSPQNVYLKSNLVNAFNLELTSKDNKTNNLKNVYFNYRYYDVNGVDITPANKGVITNATLDRVYDSEKKLYNYFYNVPITLDKPGYVDVIAKMHKTHEMEKDYIAGDFDNMIIPTSNSSLELKQQAQAKLDAYNAFLNKYKNYIDCSNDSYDFFKKNLEVVTGESEPRIKLDYSKIAESKKFVFQTTKFTIHVTTVNLKTISTKNEANTYKVLTNKTFTIDDIESEFALSVTLADSDGNEVTNVNISPAELKTLYDTMEITPWVYVEKNEFLANQEVWSDYLNTIVKDDVNIWGVSSFTNNKPNLFPLDNGAASVNGMDEAKGVLIKLYKEHNKYYDYLTITPSNDSANLSWDFNFNIPMHKNEKNFNDLTRALYLEFEVTGLNLNTLEPIKANTFSRIFINYTTYEDVEKISFTNSFSKMAVNNDLNNVGDEYSEKINRQSIDLKLKDQISNYDYVEYKRVMYFVETTSNTEESYSKVLTMGKYKFRNMEGNLIQAAISDENGNQQEADLVGERLLYSGTFDDPNYFIYAINASTTPIRVFAVVYLSDAKGNPIDLNGRPITIDEENVDEPVEIVAFAITEMTNNESIYIDSYVKNMNYYTYTLVDKAITYTFKENNEEKTASYSVAAGSLIKRNHVNSYVDMNGLAFDSAANEELNAFLQLKILADNKFDLYASNLELVDQSKTLAISIESEIDVVYVPIFEIKDFYGKVITTKAFSVNTLKNKQIAFNNFCKEVIETGNFELEGFTNPSFEIIKAKDGSDDCIAIKFRLKTDAKTGESIRIKLATTTNALNDSDRVNWQVNSVKVENVFLDESLIKPYEKLLVRPSSDSSVKDFDYGRKNESGQFDIYSLFKNDLPYSYTTNIYKDGELNPELVDPSQFNYDGSSASVANDGDENGENEIKELYTYDNIYEYISHYIINSQISFLTNDDTIQLINDLVFKTKGEDSNNIYVGNKKFPIDYLAVDIDGVHYEYSVNINGITYGVLNKEVRIKAGSYFPIINNTDKKSVVILGEEFRIEEIDGKYYVYNTEFSDPNTFPVEVTYNFKLDGFNTNYTSHDFIYDGTKDNSDTNSAITTTTNTNTTTTFVNFLKGATIKKNFEKDDNGAYVFIPDDDGSHMLNGQKGEFVTYDEGNQDHKDRERFSYSEVAKNVFVQDDNGLYVFIPNAEGSYKLNGQKGEYIIYDEAVHLNMDRYSKRGVQTFLMITFTGSAYEKPITKVITYELIQDDIAIEAINAEGKINSISNKIKVQAGVHNTINIATGSVLNQNSINIISAGLDRDNFFNHIDFAIEGSNGVQFVDNSGNTFTTISAGKWNPFKDSGGLRISVPSTYVASTFVISLTYEWLNEFNIITTHVYNVYCEIVPDFVFNVDEENSGNLGGITHPDKYILDLAHNKNDYDLVTHVYNCFEIDGAEMSLTILEGGKFATISGTTLTLAKSYANYNGESISIDRVILQITLTKGEKSVTISKKLQINIIPDYVIDTTKLAKSADNTSAESILNGESLFDYDLVKVYAYKNVDQLGSFITDKTIYTSIFEVWGNDNTEYKNGIIAPTSMNTEANYWKLKLIYIEDKNYTQITTNFVLKVHGYYLQYCKEGSNDFDEIVGGHANDLAESSGFKIYAQYDNNSNDDVKVNLNKYFRVSARGLSRNNLYLVIKDGENILPTIESCTENKTYSVWIAKFDGSNYTLLREFGTLDVELVHLFCSTTGNFGAELTFDNLTSSPAYRLRENVTISNLVEDESVNIDDYYKFFNYRGDGVEVVFKNSNDVVLDTLTVSSEEATYKVCYRVDTDTGAVVYETNYTITLTPAVGA